MINIQVKNVEAVKKKLSTLPRKLKKVVYEEAGLYLVGNETHGLQYYPPQAVKSVPPYKRTYNLRFGWMVNFNAGSKTVIKNKVPYTKYVYTRWAGRPWKWRTINKIIKSETPGMMKAINIQIEREIRKSGFGHGTPV